MGDKIMKYKYNQELPKEVEERLDAYIERINNIRWFQPQVEIDKEETDKEIKFVLKAFGVEAGIEYRELKTRQDLDAAIDAAIDAAWGAARGAAWGAARDVARGAARDAARDAAWDVAWGAARGAAWDVTWGAAKGAARDAARGTENILVMDLPAFKEKYPDGTFINLIPLWEKGLYPVGVVNGNFVVYVPPVTKS